jgi:hypothetical protein
MKPGETIGGTTTNWVFDGLNFVAAMRLFTASLICLVKVRVLEF